MFAESITHLLLGHGAVVVVGSAPTIDLALSSIDVADPDAIIVTSTNGAAPELYPELVARYPGLAIVTADLGTDKVRVITSQCVQARRADLLAALTGLPKRR
jgi:hypothetical protein